MSPAASALGAQRGLHRRLRSAERDRLCRNLRRGRTDLLGASHAAGRARRALCRHDGAGALQRRAERPFARRRAFLLRQPARQPRRASALDLASLPLLPAEHRPARRLARPIRLFDGPAKLRFTSISPATRVSRSWRRTSRCADDALSLAGHVELAVDPGAPSISRCACVFPAGAARRSSRSTARCRHQGASTDRGYAALRRRWQKGDKVGSPSPCRPSASTPIPTCTPTTAGGAEARTDRLLRGGGRHVGAAAPPRAAARRGPRIAPRARPSGRDRDLERHGLGGRAGRPGALSDRAVAGPTRAVQGGALSRWDHREAGKWWSGYGRPPRPANQVSVPERFAARQSRSPRSRMPPQTAGQANYLQRESIGWQCRWQLHRPAGTAGRCRFMPGRKSALIGAVRATTRRAVRHPRTYGPHKAAPKISLDWGPTGPPTFDSWRGLFLPLSIVFHVCLIFKSSALPSV